jgi:hypothetical protein
LDSIENDGVDPSDGVERKEGKGEKRARAEKLTCFFNAHIA